MRRGWRRTGLIGLAFRRQRAEVPTDLHARWWRFVRLYLDIRCRRQFSFSPRPAVISGGAVEMEELIRRLLLVIGLDYHPLLIHVVAGKQTA